MVLDGALAASGDDDDLVAPSRRASSTPYWMIGLSTSGSISLGCALVAGRKRVPNPAAGKMALRTLMVISGRSSVFVDRSRFGLGDRTIVTAGP